MSLTRSLCMLRVARQFQILICTLFYLTGCGNDSPSFALLPDSDTFEQSADNINNKIDILWVIDNSGSMQTSQANVQANFQSFISEFEAKGLDFQMAVTTTDAYRALYTGDPNDSRFRDGVLGNQSGFFIVDKKHS